MFTVDSDGVTWVDAVGALEIIGCNNETLRRARPKIRHANTTGVEGAGARYLYERTSVEAYAKAFRERRYGKCPNAESGEEWITPKLAAQAIGCTFETLRRSRHMIRHMSMLGTGPGARFLYERRSVEAFRDRFQERQRVLAKAQQANEMARLLCRAEKHGIVEPDESTKAVLARDTLYAEADVMLARMEAELAARAASTAPDPAPDPAPDSAPVAVCGHLLAPLCGCGR